MDKCNFCICKTCALAYYDGGAPGGGDCWMCEGLPEEKGVTSCPEYYNADKRKKKPCPYDKSESQD